MLHALVDGLAIGVDLGDPFVDAGVGVGKLLDVVGDVGEFAVGGFEVDDHAFEMTGGALHDFLGFPGAVADLGRLLVGGADFLEHRVDVARNIVGGAADVLRQGAHFIGHDGETTATFPARAASMAALRANRLVWAEICWISPTIDLMLEERWFKASTSVANSPRLVEISLMLPVTSSSSA